jgi:ABC-type nickel/cobalt efflux system permease component RcnA
MPSAAALILLLGSISAGRVGYGLLLVVGFGLGMALVLGGVGLALVYAARLVTRLPARNRFAGSAQLLQMATAGLVIVLGVVLTSQALTQVL